MSHQANHIACPNCGQDIDVNELLYQQLDEQLQKKYQQQQLQSQKHLDAAQQNVDQQKKAIAQQRREYADKLTAELDTAMKQESQTLRKKLKSQLETEQAGQMQLLQTELNEQSAKLKVFNQAQAEIAKLKREKNELKELAELDAQRRMTKELASEKAKIQRTVEARAELEISESREVIEQLTEQLKIAQRKAEQGSMQLQGEVQELAIESWLAAEFPLDDIQEIKKGARGADCLQVVNTRSQQNCGSIYYESKRAKNFMPAWIEKFKADIRDKNAHIGVLVTETMPADMQRFGLKDGVWVCSFDEFKGLSAVLRESMIQLNQAMSTQENRGDKMAMLYDYLTGNEFRFQIEAIVDGFTPNENRSGIRKACHDGDLEKNVKSKSTRCC